MKTKLMNGQLFGKEIIMNILFETKKKKLCIENILKITQRIG